MVVERDFAAPACISVPSHGPVRASSLAQSQQNLGTHPVTFPTPGRCLLPLRSLPRGRGLRQGQVPVFDDAGRAPSSKKRRTESPATVERWCAASRRYPPWQYRSTALVKVAERWDVPDAPTREWLQLLPSGYTAAASAHNRCKLLGNAWHAGVARMLVFVLLCQTQVMDAHEAVTAPWYPPVPDPVFQVRWRPDGDRPLQRVASWWLRSGLSWDPNMSLSRQHLSRLALAPSHTSLGPSP